MQLKKLSAQYLARFLVFASLWSCAGVLAEHENIIFKFAYGAYAENGEPPYYYLNSDDEFVGVVPDILRLALFPEKVEFKPVFAPRKRLMDLFERGEVDIDVMNPSWLPAEFSVLVSAQAYTDTHYIYSGRSAKSIFTSFESLVSRKICTHRGYIYGRVQEMMSSNSLLRIDANTDTQMLKMLAAGRCDILVGPAYVTDIAINELGLQGRISKTVLVDRTWPLYFIFSEKHRNLVARINEFLKHKDYEMKFARSLRRHSRVHGIP